MNLLNYLKATLLEQGPLCNSDIFEEENQKTYYILGRKRDESGRGGGASLYIFQNIILYYLYLLIYRVICVNILLDIHIKNKEY